MQEPSYRIENGRKIYSIECRVDAHRRPLIPAIAEAGANRESSNAVAPNPTGSPHVPDDIDDPDIVSVHMRVISGVTAYPTMGWLGPQRVEYGHDNSRGIREIPPHMAERKRPVPLQWNHSYDIKDKAGSLVNGYWEDSTDIEAGVNAWTRVNRKYDPKAAMGLETGEIDATSIAVWFDMERSHPDMPFEQFVEAAAGDTEIEGKAVAWLPYKLKDVLHHAMVWSGADANSGPRAIENSINSSAGPPCPENSGMSGTDAAPTTNPNMRAETPATTTAAEAADNHTPRGGITLENTPKQILDSLCRDLGFDVTLSEEGPIPEELRGRISTRIMGLNGVNARYGELEARTAKLAAEYLPADHGAITPLDIMNALAPRLDLAVHGERYIADLRAEALKAFDGAKTDPANKAEQTLAEKTIREAIAETTDVDRLHAWIAEYDGDKKAKFGTRADLRVSANEELPPVTPSVDLTAEQQRIQASMNRWMGGK